MFMSGHPLDNFKFEMQHYGLMPLASFTELKDSLGSQNISPDGNSSIPTRNFRLGGWVIDAQHKTTKTGNYFGVLVLEDYSGKAEFMLWSNDYVVFKPFLEKGLSLYVTGSFKQRYNGGQAEFKIEKLMMLDMIKHKLTKELILKTDLRVLSPALVQDLDKHFGHSPGQTTLKIQLYDGVSQQKIALKSKEKGIELTADMTNWLTKHPEIEASVVTW
jgi:DNA polymerase-3 subunit alpha